MSDNKPAIDEERFEGARVEGVSEETKRDLNSKYGEFLKETPVELAEVADDESPLNGSTVSDTQPPTYNHFLDQWQMFEESTLKDLEEVCKAGLTLRERVSLIKVGFKLLGFALKGASEEDFNNAPPDILAEMEAIKAEIEDLPSVFD